MIKTLKEKYISYTFLRRYFNDIAEDILEHLELFEGEKEEDNKLKDIFPWAGGNQLQKMANKYRVIRCGEVVGFFSFIGNGEGCDNQVNLAVLQKRSSGLCGNTLEFYQLFIFRFLRSASEDLTCNVVSQVILKALIFTGCGVLKGEVWNIRFASYF